MIVNAQVKINNYQKTNIFTQIFSWHFTLKYHKLQRNAFISASPSNTCIGFQCDILATHETCIEKQLNALSEIEKKSPKIVCAYTKFCISVFTERDHMHMMQTSKKYINCSCNFKCTLSLKVTVKK